MTLAEYIFQRHVKSSTNTSGMYLDVPSKTSPQIRHEFELNVILLMKSLTTNIKRRPFEETFWMFFGDRNFIVFGGF